MSRRWLEPIEYRRTHDGWWASARSLTVKGDTPEKARAKLYRAHRRMHRRIAETTFRRLPVSEPND